MNIGVNARVFSVDTPDGAAQVGIQHAINLVKNPEFSCRLYGHPCGKQWFDTNPTIHSPLYLFNSQLYGVIWERTVLPILAGSNDIDLLFCPNANVPPIGGGDHKVVTMIHHISDSYGQSYTQRAYRRTMVPLGVRRSDAIVTVSEFSKKKIVENLPVAEEDVYVIYNGIDPIFFEKNSGDPVDLPNEYLLFVGSAVRRKNLKKLLKAYNRIDYDIDLVVVGPEDSIAYDDENVDRDSIINLGYVSKAELRYLYANATVFVYPSLYEGFGLPPVEAAACGTPVITSNVSAIPEIMGDAAEYVDPHSVDSIREGIDIINNKERLDELSELGRQQAKKYTWEKSTKQLIDVFCSVGSLDERTQTTLSR